MKKFVAILTALMFALSLSAAVAQEKAPAPAAGDKKEEKAAPKKAKKAKKAKKDKKAEAPAATPATPAAPATK